MIFSQQTLACFFRLSVVIYYHATVFENNVSNLSKLNYNTVLRLCQRYLNIFCQIVNLIENSIFSYHFGINNSFFSIFCMIIWINLLKESKHTRHDYCLLNIFLNTVYLRGEQVNGTITKSNSNRFTENIICRP